MKRKQSVLFSKLLIGSSILIAGVASAETVTWQGGVTNWFGSSNWVVGVTADQNIPDQTTNDDDIIINSGTVKYNPGGDFGQGWGGTTVTVGNGATLSQDTTHWANWNSTGTLAVNTGGTLALNASWFQVNGAVNIDAGTMTARGVRLGNDETISTGVLTLSNGSTFNSVGQEFWFGNNDQTKSYTAGLSIDATSSLTLTGGGGASVFFWGTTQGYYTIDFVGNGGTMTVGAAGIEINNNNTKLTFEDLWDMGILTHDGTQSGLFGENFAVTGTQGSDGYTVTSIADPGQTPPLWSADLVYGVDGILAEPYVDTLAGKAYDPNGDDITYAYVSGPAWLDVASNGDLTGVPTGTGTNTFTVSATDLTGSGISTNTTLEIVVYTQDAPTWTTNLLILDDGIVDRAYTGSVAGEATDVNGDAITYSLESVPTWLSVSADGILTGTPLAENDGLNTFTIGATDADGSGLTSTTTLEITVTTPPPVYLDDWATLSASIPSNVTTDDTGWDFDGSSGTSYDYGAIDGGVNPTNGSTVEYIFNLSDAGSSIAIGSMFETAPQALTLKLEQWPNTGKFGATLPGVVDYTFATDAAFSQNLHVVFVRTGDSVLDLYVDGVFVESNVATAWRMDGGQGWLGSTSNGTDDVPVGTIFGVASYSAPLDAGTIADLYDAYINGGAPADAVAITIDGPFAGGTAMTVSWTGAAFTTYSVETNSNLVASGGWNELEGGITGAEGQIHTVTNNITGADQTFYRVQSQK